MRAGTTRPRRLSGVGRVSRVIGFAVGFLWVALSTLGVGPAILFGTGAVLFILPAVAIIIRSVMIGVWLRGGTIVIASWLWTYRVQAADVREVLSQHYSGYMNTWADTDLMARRVRVLGLDTGGDRFFPATAMTRRTADRAIPELAAALGVGVAVLA
jgi:hypothetical protein